MKVIDKIALVLIIIGAINWGLIGIFHFNLVAAIFGDMTLIARIIYGLVGFCTIYFGSSVVENVLNNIPEVVMKSLEVAGGLLPAVGFALLLQPMMTSKNSLYFFLGFIMVAFASQSVLAVTAFGVVVAFIVVFEIGHSKSNNVSDEVEDKELEALFDE